MKIQANRDQRSVRETQDDLLIFEERRTLRIKREILTIVEPEEIVRGTDVEGRDDAIAILAFNHSFIAIGKIAFEGSEIANTIILNQIGIFRSDGFNSA